MEEEVTRLSKEVVELRKEVQLWQPRATGLRILMPAEYASKFDIAGLAT